MSYVDKTVCVDSRQLLQLEESVYVKIVLLIVNEVNIDVMYFLLNLCRKALSVGYLLRHY